MKWVNLAQIELWTWLGSGSIGRLEMLTHPLTFPPVMAFPDFTKPFVLHTDASQEGLGALLYQEQDGKLRVLGYASRTLTPSEKN